VTATAWFDDAGLGIFVHWDHASQQGLEVSWPLVGGLFALKHCRSVPVAQYHSSATTFDPRAFDARALAESARAAGARYLVFTTKHHSGYAMFKTRTSRFSVEHSPCGRDLVGEVADAVRSAGLRLGFYFSLSDWSHPDYPAFTEADKPYVPGRSPPLPSREQWERYLEAMREQLRELLTGYGRVDLLWFDGGWERPFDMWRGSELVAHIRSLQPDILLNDRLYGFGDYDTPEQFVPPKPPPRRWETCLTMNESWGYDPDDRDYKSARRLVHMLAEVRAKGGNLLLNVSPRGDGSLPPEQIERLARVGRWMDASGESIHGAGPGLEPWQFYGPSTRREGRVYLHLLARPYDAVTVRGVPVRRVERVSVLATGAELSFSSRTGILEGLQDDPDGELTIEVPPGQLDDLATVLAVDFGDTPRKA
jgi:alpha-L-fucosidase